MNNITKANPCPNGELISNDEGSHQGVTTSEKIRDVNVDVHQKSNKEDSKIVDGQHLAITETVYSPTNSITKPVRNLWNWNSK